jgi:hypothetical protein
MGNLSEAGESLSIPLVNLAGLLTGGVLTLLGARVWARRIETGPAIFGRNRARPMTERGEPSPHSWWRSGPKHRVIRLGGVELLAGFGLRCVGGDHLPLHGLVDVPVDPLATNAIEDMVAPQQLANRRLDPGKT